MHIVNTGITLECTENNYSSQHVYHCKEYQSSFLIEDMKINVHACDKLTTNRNISHLHFFWQRGWTEIGNRSSCWWYLLLSNSTHDVFLVTFLLLWDMDIIYTSYNPETFKEDERNLISQKHTSWRNFPELKMYKK